MAVAHGSCLCKKVTYEVDLPFERFMYCHCSRCRKATGAAHAANGFVMPEQFRLLSGAEFIKRFDMPEAKRFGTNFCTNCGSRVPGLIRTGERVLIPAGSLDEDPTSRPQAVIFWGSRAPWFTDCSGMTKHDELPK